MRSTVLSELVHENISLYSSGLGYEILEITLALEDG